MQNVLVVDDHLNTCQLLVKLLKILGYPAACVESGRAALDIVKRTGRRWSSLMS
jgi:CheY-like chemotaxis protein